MTATRYHYPQYGDGNRLLSTETLTAETEDAEVVEGSLPGSRQ